MLIDPFQTSLFYIRRAFAEGRFEDAAQDASEMAQKWSEPYRTLVLALTEALHRRGNSYPLRGRPKKKSLTTTGLLLSAATGRYRAAVYARRLVDGDKLSARKLVILRFLMHYESIYQDMDEWAEQTEKQYVLNLDTARSALLPHAREFLRKQRLSRVPRRGFKGFMAERIARKWGVSVRSLMRNGA